MLKWRARSRAKLNKRFLHLVDSQVTLGAMTKHRSPAPALIRVASKAAAWQLAAGFRPIVAFCRSHSNPADKPSRVILSIHKPRVRPAAPLKRDARGAAAAGQ